MSRRELVLALVGLHICIFLGAIDTSIVNTALPRIATELHGFELYAWVTTGYLLTSTAVVPVAGKVGDRFGRKPLMLGGVGYFLLITALCGFAQDMLQLIALRTLQGVGAGVLFATVFGSMGELLTPVARARISGLITATFSSANVLGPLVGGFLTDTFTWRAVFYANLPFGLLALSALWLGFPNEVSWGRARSRKKLPIDVAGAITVTAATVVLLLALAGAGRDYPWDSPILVGSLALVGAMLLVFVRIESRALDPVVPLRLFRDNVIALSAFGSLVHQMASFGAALFIPLFVQAVLGASATVSGGLLAPMVAAMLLVNVAVGLGIAHFGRYKAFLLIGFAVATIGFVLLTAADANSAYALLILAMVIIGIGSGCLVGTLNLAAQNAARLSEMGVVTAFTQYSRSMGGTLGSAILGSILLVQLGPAAQAVGEAPLGAMREQLASALHWVFVTSAVLMGAGLMAMLFMRELPMRRRGPAAESTTPYRGSPAAEHEPRAAI